MLSSSKQIPRISLLMVALSLSGASGVINQVVWQRALKVFLGGSETISAMIVVLVFLGGLGAGSVWMGRKIEFLHLPTKVFARIELLLAITNYGVCYVLSLDLSETIFYFQKSAISTGIPLRAIYALSAFVLLAVPCLLMGTSLPVASAVCQRELKLREKKSVNKLFFVNTLGAVVGSLIGVGILVPHWGQRFALLTAASLNLMAGVILIMMSQALVQSVGTGQDTSISNEGKMHADRDSRISGFAILAFGFGFWALWYEMFLYRTIALYYEPLPLVFSAVLSGFLVFWSLGIFVSSLKNLSYNLSRVVFLSAVSVVGMLLFLVLDENRFPLFTTWQVMGFIVLKAPFFSPCFFFGMLFGLTLEKAIRLWGRDVGWFNAWNTTGSCCGILLATFIGYELNVIWMLFLQCLGLLALRGVVDKIQHTDQDDSQPPSSCYSPTYWLYNQPTLIFGLIILVTTVSCFVIRASPARDGLITSFFGRDGVITIDEDGNLTWDGLWHSRLSARNDHVGSYNWALAVDPVLAHPTGIIGDALVIGVGSGITVGTLAKHHTISMVDAYDINQTLKRVLEQYPQGTLHIETNPKVNIIWQDARSGLAVNNKQYDLITQQPLYLRQAGSSILLSKEYFALVSKRMKKDAVYCVYANGTPEQALAVRQTASEIFPHMLILHSGYQLILSKIPLDFDRDHIEALLQRQGNLWDEVRGFRRRIGEERWNKHIQPYQLPMADSKIVIRDDFPIVEYPEHIRGLLKSTNITEYLPHPHYEDYWK